MQFQIEKLILWPKNQKYSYKDIELNTNSVNVITGDSRTGKSAIIPIIDYCLASGECYIPTQTIRNACSWFGVVIKLEKNKVLLARREPGAQKSTSDMLFIQGEEIEIPEIPEKNTNCQAVKRFLDEYARLSFLETEDTYYGSRPAFRDLMSFCFQPQNVVANANILFYKTDKTEHRNKLINIFPYVLGAITPEALSARQELMDLQRKLKKKESDYEKLCELTIRWENEIKAWISVAIELGLLEETSRNMKFEAQLVLLQELVKNNTEEKVIKSNGIIKSSEEMVMLREKENELAMELTKYKNRHIEMSQLMKSVSEYRDALSIQVERLNIAEWLDEKARKEHICPVCQQKCSDDSQRNIYLSRLEDNRKKKKQMEEIPAAFEREYDMVKGQIQRLTDELVAVQKRIRIEENKLKPLRENDEANHSRYTLDGISRFLGKIEYASETIASLESDGELSYKGELSCMLQIRQHNLSGAYITFNQEMLLSDYFVSESEFETKHNVGRYEDEEEMYMQIQNIRINLNAHTAHHVYKLFEELKEEYYETRRQINSILGVEGLNKDGDKYLLMTIDTMEWEEILFFARNHDWFQDGDEIEWNIFNNNGSTNSLILSPNVYGTVRGDILAKISVYPNEFGNNKLNLYWEPGFKSNERCMDCFDNIVKWKADYTEDWIKNKLLEKAHIYYEKFNGKPLFWQRIFG